MVEGARELREMELARLDALQASYPDRAVNGDVRAATLALPTIERRSRLLGMNRMEMAGEPSFLVVGGDLVG